MDGSFVAQRESRFRLHCAIRVQNHQLFPGGNSWQFIVKIRGGQVLGVGLAMQPFFLYFVTGHPGLFCDWASSSNKILSRSWPFCSAPVWLLLCSANAKPQYCVVNSLDQWNYSKILPDTCSLAALCRKQNPHVIQQELMNRHGEKERWTSVPILCRITLQSAPYMDYKLLVLMSFEVTTVTSMHSQEPAC